MNKVIEIEEEVQALELRLLTKEGRADASFLSEMLSDNSVECGANWRVFGKDDVLARLPDEDDLFKIVAVDMVTNMVTENVAINRF